MEFIPGLLKANIVNWKGKEWYHQRFDGSPFLMHFIAEAECRVEPRKMSCHNYVHYCWFNESKADWYIEMDDIKRIYTILIDESKKNPQLSRRLLREWKQDEEKFYEKCHELMVLNFSKLRDEDLLQVHQEFLEIALRRNSSSSVIDGFALGTDRLVADLIEEAYEKSLLKNDLKFTEVFSILTAPVHLSFINEAEAALLKIALEVKNDPSMRKQLLQQHQQDFFWIRNNYVDAHVLDVNYFNEELEKILSLNLNLRQEIDKIQNTPAVNQKKKEEMMRKIHLSNELKTLLTISEDFTHWQDERKKASFWTAHCATLLLNEVSKRVNVPVLLLKFSSPRELGQILDKRFIITELEQRYHNSVFYWDLTGHDCVTGKETDFVKEKIMGKTGLSDVDDFRGLTASMGKAIGTVKVIKSVRELHRVQSGDILVAVMTRPDYIAAMKKAAAIVTDEGGVTCHAAIVARELGIPCIIGTKIATQVLKDGMQVEVNANHGWVRVRKK